MNTRHFPAGEKVATTLFLVRHTPVNISKGTCYGSTDAPLDEPQFAASLPTIHLQLPLRAVMLCSPLSRCLQLARALHTLSTERLLTVAPELVERDFGRWEGRDWNHVPRDQIDAWAANYLHYSPPDGESVALMASRTVAALTLALRNKTTDAPLIIISHAGPLAAICAHLSGVDLHVNTVSAALGSVTTLRL